MSKSFEYVTPKKYSKIVGSGEKTLNKKTSKFENPKILLNPKTFFKSKPENF